VTWKSDEGKCVKQEKYVAYETLQPSYDALMQARAPGKKASQNITSRATFGNIRAFQLHDKST
jgi:hypothetical protein